MSSLKSFVKAVRAAKTIADERSVIQKESAAIRTSFREDYTDQSIRRQNVAKLLYLFTLGERTHFGQVECLKLLATSRFGDKRLGYLGTMLLLDENQEVLTLVTNSLSNDLSNPNQYVVGLALCTLANIASTEMARDLFADIEKILSAANPYLRKKAALCAMRIIRRVPDLEENFVDKAKLLISDKNHGVLLCGASLIQDMCEQNFDLVDQFKPLIPTIIKHLKTLSTSGYAPEHDVTGVSDPFLQVKLLRLLRILGNEDAQASEQMSDILAQIASNTDSSKNVGNAVLYEAVSTIFGIEADSGLRVLGVNILGKFLSTKDNNTRYVALNTLLRVVEIEPTAVQRHRATIIECLQDSDISIRRRALELSFALINDTNIRVLVRELLAFLETADSEFKSTLVSQIALCAEKFAPNKRWHVDTILRALKLAGGYVKENVLSAFITMVITADDQLQLYTVQKLYSALKSDVTQEGLTLVGVWLIGEYGNILLKGGSFSDDGERVVQQQVSEQDIVSLLESCLDSSYATETIQEYVLNALMKLSVRITNSTEIERIRRILEQKSKSLNIEVQQRVAEYGSLFSQSTDIRKGVLEKMPPPEIRDELSRKYQQEKEAKSTRKVQRKAGAASASTTMDLLLDLGGDDTVTSASTTGANSADLLSDIFGNQSATTSPVVKPAQNQNQNILDLFDNTPKSPQPSQSSSLDGLFVSSGSSAFPAAAADATDPGLVAYDNDLLRLSFHVQQKEAPGTTTILAKFENTGAQGISDLVLQVAVPKSQKLQLQALSNNTVASGSYSTQVLKVSGSPGQAVRLRLRIAYSVGGREVKQQLDFSKFASDVLA